MVGIGADAVGIFSLTTSSHVHTVYLSDLDLSDLYYHNPNQGSRPDIVPKPRRGRHAATAPPANLQDAPAKLVPSVLHYVHVAPHCSHLRARFPAACHVLVIAFAGKAVPAVLSLDDLALDLVDVSSRDAAEKRPNPRVGFGKEVEVQRNSKGGIQ